MREIFESVDFIEPDAEGLYPLLAGVANPDYVFFHAPSLQDRRRPWSVLYNALYIRKKFPSAKFISIVHEFSEAPIHWKARQILLSRLSSASIVNSKADYEGIKNHAAKLLRSKLGPTLSIPEILSDVSVSNISKRRSAVRERLCVEFDLHAHEKWLLHPGLLTPGKGVDQLEKLASRLDSKTRLIVMGGIGPRDRDRSFANKVISALSKQTGGRALFIKNPSDQVFSEMLLAADLVVLPYDAGVSERRSSFLSAMSCGANVWTTIGQYSDQLELDRSGALLEPVQNWISGDEQALKGILQALHETEEAQMRRRALNLSWAELRSWSRRAQDVKKFIEKELDSKR